MAKEKKRRSLIFSIMRLLVIPVIILGIILTVYSQISLQEGIHYEIERELSGIAHNLISTYNILDGGEFHYEDGHLKKGERELTSDYRLLDDIKNDTGADVTIFYGNERRLTTILDKDGNRAVGTEVSAAVASAVLEDGEEFFSNHVDVNGVNYFGYYVPIRDDDGKVIGISFAGKSAEDVDISLKYMIQGNVIICIFVILLAGFVSNITAHKMVEAIQHIKRFLGKLAHGDFSQKMSNSVLSRWDELADMGEYAMTVCHSLDDMVSKDPLTGLLNRRACLIQVENRNRESEFSVAMGDIDFFKKVNDCYGHEKGDEVLCFVADVLGKMVGEAGFVSRWGGEEFLIGYSGSVQDLYNKTKEAMVDIKRRMFRYGEEQFNVSMTFGISLYDDEETFDDVVRQADDLLYYGKEHGRDQIVLEKDVKSQVKGEVENEGDTDSE